MFSSAIINNYERYSEVFNCQFLQVDNPFRATPKLRAAASDGFERLVYCQARLAA
jgi:hypothetical protein